MFVMRSMYAEQTTYKDLSFALTFQDGGCVQFFYGYVPT